MDYHAHSLNLLDQIHAKEDRQVEAKYQSFYVITPAWEEWANNKEELKALLDDATLAGIHAEVQTCPF